MSDPRATDHDKHFPSQEDFGPVLEKLKLLQFGLFGLQQYGKNAPLDLEDLGPFFRLAEEIESDLLELTRRLPAERTDG
ncbi:MAG TPA: hypothetical protein VMD08_16975 [Candidatus Baltobacteraceae bacterium]|nr:hypothetical protein [Candidatus Baltobacteraceae bacterium]